MEYYSVYKSPIGLLRLVSDGESLVKSDFEFCDKSDKLPVFDNAKIWLDNYFSGRGKYNDIKIPLLLSGTDFRKKVWKILTEISYGNTVTYKEVAQKINPEMSAQAVGGATGKNPLLIFVPCHRVIGSDGSLTGYSAGIEKKKFLLEMEQNQL